jgi:protein O-mannosyl-transferase
MAIAAESPRWKSREYLMLAAVLIVTALVCSRALSNGFLFDDHPLVLENVTIGDWLFPLKALTRDEYWYSDASWVPHSRYRPVLLIWFWLDYHLFGLHAPFWHASILAVHLMAVWLVFKIARVLVDDSNSALLAALLFGIIPVHAQAVDWVSASGLVIGTTLELAAFYLIMKRRDARAMMLASVLYAPALLCHESVVVFPALVALYVFLFGPSREGERSESAREQALAGALRAAAWAAPFAIEVLGYFFVRWLVLGVVIKAAAERSNLLTPAQDVMTMPLVLMTYLTLLAAPWLALPDHRVFPVSSAVSPHFWIPVAAMVALGAALVLIWQRRARRKFYLLYAGWVGISLTPMMGLSAVPHLVQDMYLYLPSVGWCVLVGDLAAHFPSRSPVIRRLALGAAAALLVVCAATLWRVEHFWRDDLTASRGYVEGFPESVAWHSNVARFLENQGDFAQAEDELRTALSLEPDRTGVLRPPPEVLHLVLGDYMARRGDIDGAVREFTEGRMLGRPVASPAVAPSAPAPADHFDLASQLQARGDLAGAQRELDADLRLNTGDGRALYSRGVLDVRMGHLAEAAAEVDKGLSLMSDAPPMAYATLAEIYDLQADDAHREVVLKKIESMPGGDKVAGMARASALIRHGDVAGAERVLRALTDRYPTVPGLWGMLGQIQVQANQNQEALLSFRHMPGNSLYSAESTEAGDYLQIAQVLHAMGRDREAFDQCRLALALDPGKQAAQSLKAELQNNLAARNPQL